MAHRSQLLASSHSPWMKTTGVRPDAFAASTCPDSRAVSVDMLANLRLRVLGRSWSAPGAVVEVNGAVAEPALVQQLEVHPDIVAGQGTLAASHHDGHEEQLVLVDEPSLDRLGRE